MWGALKGKWRIYFSLPRGPRVWRILEFLVIICTYHGSFIKVVMVIDSFYVELSNWIWYLFDSLWKDREILESALFLWFWDHSLFSLLRGIVLNKHHGPLAKCVKLWVAHAPGMPGTFSPSTASKENVSKRSRHASRHVRHARAVMRVEITNPRLRGKCSRHSRRMRNPQFYVSGKRTIAPAGLISTQIGRPGARVTSIVMLSVHYQYWNI